MDVSDAALRSLLRERFGFTDFRPGQQRIIRDLLAGRDVLAVLPTGAGKSLVYQLAAQLLPGLTVVVSPLLALMKDQVESAEALGVDAASVSSAQSTAGQDEQVARAERQETALLYVTPERLEKPEFLARLRGLTVSLLVIDEAHCISEWGPSFRPAYLTLPAAIDALGQPTLLALTATATPWVRRDLVERLQLREPDVVVLGVDRPNLFLEVQRVETEGDDARVLRQLLAATDAASDDGSGDPPAALRSALAETMQGSGIVYTATTRAAAETARWLRDWGIAADYYHGQRKRADRERVQEAFMAGELRVIAATNAFGLGVDKPDVRFVIHRDVPASLDAYYQEIGRAGRDGELARCTLIYRPGDLGRAAFLGSSGQLTVEDVGRARVALVERGARTVRALVETSGLSRPDALRAVEALEAAGVIRARRGRLRLLVPDFEPAEVSLEGEERRRAYEHSRLEMMRGYAELLDCRRRYLLEYFGEEYPTPRCGRCDNDRLHADAPRTAPLAAAVGPFAVHDRVCHPSWGAGVVQRVAGDAITVLFDEVGYKMLRTDVVVEQGLLEPASS